MFTLIDESLNNKHFIHAYTLANMHNKLLKMLKKYGKIVYINNQKTCEIEFVNSVIEYPENEDMPKTTKWQNRKALEVYTNEIITDIIPDGFTYTYGDKIYHPINQVEQIIKILKNDLYSRQATIMIGDSSSLLEKEPPCCRIVDFKYRNEKLNMNLVFRSHDVTAYFPNIWAFRELQRIIAKRLQVATGVIRCTSESLHLYKGDFNLMEEI